jgi:hypothetical protein
MKPGHFKGKKEYLKDEINDSVRNSRNKNVRGLYRGINKSKRGYQPRNKLVKDENDLLADSHNILNRWKSYFYQLLNVYGVSDVRQIEIHTAGASHLEVETAIAKLKSINLQAVIKCDMCICVLCCLVVVTSPPRKNLICRLN